MCESKKFKLNDINSYINNYANLETNVNTNIQEDLKQEKSSILKNSQKSLKQHKNILYLEIMSSSYENKGSILKITPEGLVNSIRNAHDGITYFGYVDDNNLKKNVTIIYI